MELLHLIDLIGTFVFAVSGVMAAAENKMDFFGASVIGFVTAVGGGTIRDLLIGSLPVGWMMNIQYLVLIFAAIICTVLFRKLFEKLYKALFLFDTIGIGLFTVLGVQKTLAIGLHPLVALMMGMVSAVFGGVVRDVLSGRVPLIFRKEIYATACLAGASVYVILWGINAPEMLAILLSMTTTISIRVVAVLKKWQLPQLS